MIYIFENYEFDTARRELRRAGVAVRLEPKVFDLLAYLLEHHGHFVSRTAIYEQLWPGQYVSDSALTYCIAEARKAVGDNGRTQRILKTMYGRGYCFIAPVQEHTVSPPVATLPSMMVPPPEVESGHGGRSQRPVPSPRR
ncbi:MAG: transcriptional regulator [Candidatus Tectomicrobia bacterium]|uniref:Transcriptional regulator n=1 Tax=Tectimicrobiota bacterium TaxID=2528274 RepID=A0A937W306_UNCTE|nr:transcriptional regulator [Candidatus Tectomicrobia bacterium]